MVTYLFLMFFAYMIGLVPADWLLGRYNARYLFHQPVAHVFGLRKSLLFVGIDFVKGIIVTLIGLAVAGWTGACLAAIFVNLGTVFPFSPIFRGTRTVGTAAGALLVLSPLLLLIGLGIFVLMIFSTQYLSLSLVLSTVIVLIVAFVLRPSWFILLVICLLAAGVFYLQRKSYSRFLQGKEPPFPLRRLIRR